MIFPTAEERYAALAAHDTIADAARALGMKSTTLSEWLRNNPRLDPAVRDGMANLGMTSPPADGWIIGEKDETGRRYSFRFKVDQNNGQDFKEALAEIITSLAAPAFASDSAMFGNTGCKLTLTPGQAHVAEVHCRNILEGGSPVNAATLTAGWLTVDLIIRHQPGDIPDRFEVIPPDGYSAGWMDVEEDGEGVILVYPYLGF